MRPGCSIFILIVIVKALICSIADAHVVDEPTRDANLLGHIRSSTPSGPRVRRGKSRARSLSRYFEASSKSSDSRLNRYKFNRRSEYLIGDPSELSKGRSTVKNLSPRKHPLTHTIPIPGKSAGDPIVGLTPKINERKLYLGNDSSLKSIKTKARRMVYGWINPGYPYDGVGLAVIRGMKKTKTKKE